RSRTLALSEPRLLIVAESINIAELMRSSGVGFGTSGARGLASDMSDCVCYAYTAAFLDWLKEAGLLGEDKRVAIAGDFRPSSPRIMAAVGMAVLDAGLEPVNCGFIPTPAVALYGLKHGIPAIMVTGSHIPDDRNGIKFYKPAGEILKNDEQAMTARNITVAEDLFDTSGAAQGGQPLPPIDLTAQDDYIRRYTDFLPADCLKGKRVGVYQHSTVARDIFAEVFTALGAEVNCLGRSDVFIPVDTEAIRIEDVELAKQWSIEHGFDCIVSADGDGDRPLISDASGNWLRGDVAGILCARFLQARHIATPVSCNSAVEKCGWFANVERTRIGSPFVIETMQQMHAEGASGIVGYEANGGFLTGDDITLHDNTLSALPTRDALIVPLAILLLAAESNTSISGLLATLPQCFTASDRIKDFPGELSREKLAPLNSGDAAADIHAAEALLGASFGNVISVDTTDGIRISFDSNEVAHLRPSGNAPELRCYTEASSEARAVAINKACIELLAGWKPGGSRP
ncbi:MAG: phosphomannomutase, partial [Mariprofundaceae bacterium]|nr:phosphomannomutase [Mariprofundaceae bacterium]